MGGSSGTCFRLIAIGIAILAFDSIRLNAQEAVILTEPADWKLETMPVPPSFAPDIRLKGAEEIRFAPGMFSAGSSNYFTCLIAISADRAPKLDMGDVKRFVELYYRGLATVGGNKVTAAQRKEMVATVTEAKTPDQQARQKFNASMVLFDPFHDGQKVTLNIEAVVVPRPATKQTCLILMVSPSATDSEVWKNLRILGGQAAVKAANNQGGGQSDTPGKAGGL